VTNMFEGNILLITGGTGTSGNAVVKRLFGNRHQGDSYLLA
jgi:FlaA1/EpsC-like NDP-sugar epimerase